MIQPFDRIATGFQTVGNMYLEGYKELSEVLFKEVTALRKELSKAIKMAIKEEKKLRSDFNAAKDDAQKAKQKDFDEKKHLEELQLLLFSDNNLPPKKLEKLQKDVNNAEKKSRKAEEDYELAIKRLHEMDQSYYLKLGVIMSTMEALDRKRFNEMRELMKRFSKLHINIGKNLTGQSDYMEQGFDAMNEEKEIQSFITANRSGTQPPPPDNFEPYIIKISDDVNKKRFSTMNGGNITPVSPTITSTKTPEKQITSSASTGSFSNSSSSLSKAPTAAVVETKSAPANDAPTTVLKTVTCIYGYDAAEDGELSIKEGDFINVLEMNGDGWWYGINSTGQTGLFPSNFVEEVSQSSIVPGELLNQSSGDRMVAQFDYDATDDQELSFKVGDVFTIVEVNNDGWFVGKSSSGKQGLIPSNFFKPEDK